MEVVVEFPLRVEFEFVCELVWECFKDFTGSDTFWFQFFMSFVLRF
jgi:hypothetical protein